MADYKHEPLVSVVTPVYNTEKYLAECIESVLKQTYTNWQYIIVNNCSSDNSPAIAEEYAELDSRITVHTNSTFLNQIQNWNHALRLIHPESKYCKEVHADDWIYPECLERMVDLAEKHPDVGIVSSYRLVENRVSLSGLPPDVSVMPGAEACRLFLLGNLYLFGSPTTLLLRSELVRNNDPFYDEKNLHADTDACLRYLTDWDFGFVHQVLSYTRRHNESATSITNRFETRKIAKVKAFKSHAGRYLTAEEINEHYKILMNNYHRFLAQMLYEFKGLDFWKYHRSELQSVGESIHKLKLLKSIILEMRFIRKNMKRLMNFIQAGKEDDRGMNTSRQLNNIYSKDNTVDEFEK